MHAIRAENIVEKKDCISCFTKLTFQIRVSVDEDERFESEKPEKQRIQNNGTQHPPPMEVKYPRMITNQIYCDDSRTELNY